MKTMNRRAPVQKQHERAVMLDFLGWYNAESATNFVIIEEPDPPDAIVMDGEISTWLEVTDTFYSVDWAKTKLSHATPGEANIPWNGGLQTDMDKKIAERFVENLHKKLIKKTYKPFAEDYGPGILLVTLEYPWLSKETFDVITERCEREDWSDDLMCFSEVYIVYPAMNKKLFARLIYA